MHAVARFRSQLLACGAPELAVERATRCYEHALRTAQPADWERFYRAVYAALDAVRATRIDLTIFSRIELEDMLLLLHDDLGSELFAHDDLAALRSNLSSIRLRSAS